jgi:hypothetical protein
MPRHKICFVNTEVFARRRIMHVSHHAPDEPNPELTSRVAHSLGIGEMTLNEIDYDDLYVSDTVIKTLHHLAMTILHQVSVPEEGLTIRAYWVEASMELVLCADSGKDLHLVRVPGEHWTFKQRTYH